MGGYGLTFAKDGYLTQTRIVALGLRCPLSLVQILPAAPARITGRVPDQSGAELINVTVTAAGGGKTVTGFPTRRDTSRWAWAGPCGVPIETRLSAPSRHPVAVAANKPPTWAA